ncbi:hypothetical protein Taro_054974 [Colocasia esculenta]|uniref:Uncharacterized protein n=1 Tax=Colocasia esculenta TaxID=4460 RepID=A0A843XSV6_COLES|nr:hypothetical protein [Colocasia esculenta]
MAVAIRVCRGLLSYRDKSLSWLAFSARPGLVAVAPTIAMVSRWLKGVRHGLVCLECFRGHGWRVDMCPRAGCALRTFWWECGRLPLYVQ